MKPLSTRLIDRLAQRRIRARIARASVSGGERAAGVTGSGMEFVEHRQYQPGDDLRHIDRHAYARFRTPYVKRFAADRGLDVTILLDRSSSMPFGRPSKREVAETLAAGIACTALAGGDRVRVGTFSGGGTVAWHQPVVGMGRLNDVVTHLMEGPLDGTTNLLRLAEESERRITQQGLVVVLSDWWTDHVADAARVFAGRGRELVAVHVLSAEEVEPDDGIHGPILFEDAETGESLKVDMHAGVHTAYRVALERWRNEIRGAVEGVGGRYLAVRTDEDVERVLLQEWLAEGFIT